MRKVMNGINMETMTVCIEFSDFLDSYFCKEIQYRPIFKTVWEEVRALADGEERDYSFYARIDYQSMRRVAYGEMAKKMIDETEYRQMLLNELSATMDWMFELAADKVGTVDAETKRRCYLGATGLQEHIPKINAVFEYPIDERTADALMGYLENIDRYYLQLLTIELLSEKN